MDDYISRQAAIDALGEEPFVWNEDDESELAELFEWRRCRGIIEALQPADVRPVVRGKWIKLAERSGWCCSVCKKDDLYAYRYGADNERELQDFFCPNCGAQMGGDAG